MGLFDIFGTGDQKQAAQDQIAGITTGLNTLNSDFTQGQNALTSNYSAALQPFISNANTANAGTTQLGNVLGLNGPAGSDAALKTLEATPGYQFQLQQGNNAITAADAASGKTASGNEAIDLAKFNQGLAGTTYQNYVNNLQPYLGLAQNSAAGYAGIDTGLGSGLNQSFQNMGNAAYGANTSIGNANANADLAGLNASANGLGAIAGIGKAAMSALPMLGFLSDERAKDDIEPVGELYDGKTVYRYRYKGDPRHQIGLIAQEVEETDPDAIVDMGPLMGVDYRKATSRAAELARFSA